MSPLPADAVIRPSDGGGGRHFHHKGAARRREAAKRSGPLPEKLTPVKRANVMDQVRDKPILVCMVAPTAQDAHGFICKRSGRLQRLPRLPTLLHTITPVMHLSSTAKEHVAEVLYDYVSIWRFPCTITEEDDMQRNNHSDLRPLLRCSSCPQTCQALQWRQRHSLA